MNVIHMSVKNKKELEILRKELITMILSLQNMYLSFFYFLKGPKLSKCVGETGRRKEVRAAILTFFFDPCCDSILKALGLCFPDECFQPRAAVGRVSQPRAPAGHSLAITSVTLCLTISPRLTVLTWVPVYIFFHNARVFFRLSTYVICLHTRIACFLVINYTLVNPVQRNPWLMALSKVNMQYKQWGYTATISGWNLE